MGLNLRMVTTPGMAATIPTPKLKSALNETFVSRISDMNARIVTSPITQARMAIPSSMSSLTAASNFILPQAK